MSEHIEDPSGEVVDRVARVTLTAAAVLGRRLADDLRERAARQQAVEAGEAARLQEWWNAEQASARALLQATGETSMQTATPEEAAEAWSTAHAWAAVDPTFRADDERLRQGIQERWGVDVAAGDGESLRRGADVESAKAHGEDRAQAADEVAAGGILAGTSEELAALEDADRHRTNAERSEAAAASLDASADAVAYDSDERRQALADRARAAGVDHQTVDGRLRAASANAEPVKNATKKSRSQTKVRRRGGASERTRTDQLSR